MSFEVFKDLYVAFFKDCMFVINFFREPSSAPLPPTVVYGGFPLLWSVSKSILTDHSQIYQQYVVSKTGLKN